MTRAAILALLLTGCYSGDIRHQTALMTCSDGRWHAVTGTQTYALRGADGKPVACVHGETPEDPDGE